jgi:hypothetical protein
MEGVLGNEGALPFSSDTDSCSTAEDAESAEDESYEEPLPLLALPLSLMREQVFE